MPKRADDVLSPDHWGYESEARRRTLAWAKLEGRLRIAALSALAASARMQGMEWTARDYEAKVRELEAREQEHE